MGITLVLEVQATGSYDTMKFLFAVALVVVLAQAHAGSLSLNAKFAAFKHSHGKQYTDAFEEAYRKGIFAANLAKINQHNVEHANGEHTWKMAVNQFADLTHDEFMAMNTLNIQTCHKHQRNTKCKPSPSLPALTGEILELSPVSRIKDNADLAGLSELLLPWKLPIGINTDQPSK